MPYTTEYLTVNDTADDAYEGVTEADFLAHRPDEAYLPAPGDELTPLF